MLIINPMRARTGRDSKSASTEGLCKGIHSLTRQPRYRVYLPWWKASPEFLRLILWNQIGASKLCRIRDLSHTKLISGTEQLGWLNCW